MNIKNSLWKWTAYKNFARRVDWIRGGMARNGVGANDAVAIISGHRLEWAITAYATFGLRATLVPINEAQRPEDWEYAIRDSGAKMLLVSNRTILEKVEGFSGRISSLEKIVCLEHDPYTEHLEEAIGFCDLMYAGQTWPHVATEPDREDLACIVYVFGTMEEPNGVKLTHRNITPNILAAIGLISLGLKITNKKDSVRSLGVTEGLMLLMVDRLIFSKTKNK